MNHIVKDTELEEWHEIIKNSSIEEMHKIYLCSIIEGILESTFKTFETKELKAKDKRIKELEDEYKSYRKTMESFEQELCGANWSNGTALIKRERIEERIAELNTKCDEKNALLLKKCGDIDHLYGLSVKRKERIEELEAENERLLNIEYQDRLKLVEKLTKRDKKLFQSLQERIAELEAENLKLLQDTLNPWRERITTLEKALLDFHENMDGLDDNNMYYEFYRLCDKHERLIKEIKEKYEQS